jgi:ABC-2 type transport system ATP-binding protein
VNVIALKNVSKQYANHKALDDISITVPKGCIYGLLGPNGAGKTSMIRIMTQITAPDSGQVLFNDVPMVNDDIFKIGYLPEERGLYKKMKVSEQLMYFAQLKGLSKSDATNAINHWMETFDLKEWADKKTDELSKGMQQKVQFIAAIIHKPELIILDEPFSGFDPVNAEIIKDEILKLNQAGKTIILSTHRMENVEELCSKICLINKSKKLIEGSVKEVKSQYSDSSYLLNLASNNLEGIKSEVPGIFLIEQKEDYLKIIFKPMNGQSMNESISNFMKYGNILKLEENIPSVKDVFVNLVNADNQDK